MTRYFCCLFFLLFSAPVFAADITLEDAFSPDQGATALVIKTIGEARKTIRVAAYSFTSRPIAEALVAAQQKGVDVKLVLDKSQRRGRSSLYAFLIKSHVPTRINARYHIMHNKFMIIDGKIVETGSFNYTKSAEKNNAENVLVVRRNRKIDRDYLKQWQKLWDEGE